MSFYAHPIEQPGLTRAFAPSVFNVTDRSALTSDFILEIQTPRRVAVQAAFTSQGVAFRGRAEVRDGELVELRVGRFERGPVSKKQTAIDETALEDWATLVRPAKEHATGMLEDEAYVAQCAAARQLVEASLKEKIRRLADAINDIRAQATSDWLEVGSRSTASMGNLEMEAAVRQAHLAAAVETFKHTIGQLVDVDLVAHELIEAAALPVRIRLYV